MPRGRRARFGGRGRERVGWPLPAVVVFAVLWAVAQVWAWPVWARVILAGLAAAALLAHVRVWVKQRDARAGALAGRVVTVPGHSDRLPLVREVESAQLRVRSAVVAVPYIERDVHQQVAQALGPGGAVLLVGHSMAGKTRLAAHVVGQRFPGAALLIPASGKALRDLVIDEGLDVAGVVVWLDGLERFPPGRAHHGPAGSAHGWQRDPGGHHPPRGARQDLPAAGHDPAFGVGGAGQVRTAGGGVHPGRRAARNTVAELARIRAAVPDPRILAAVQRCGLAEFLGGGPLVVDKFERGETSEPVGSALVRAAVDWRRSGLTRAIAQAGPG